MSDEQKRSTQILAVSPDGPEDAQRMLERVEREYGSAPSFPLLWDQDHQVIDGYGLLNPNPTSRGRTGLPHPATFVLDRSGVVRWRFVETNHRIRAENAAILQALEDLEQDPVEAQEYPAPRRPVINGDSKAELIDSVPAILARTRLGKIAKGSTLLIVADRSLDARLTEALQQHAVAEGARVDVVTLNGFPEVKSPTEMWRRWGDNWWPDWLWRAVVDYDYLINMTYLVTGCTFQQGQEIRRWCRNQGIRAALNVRPSVEIMQYRPYVEFPEELMVVINRKVLDEIPRGKVQIHVTSPLGTDLWFEDDYSEELSEVEEDPPTASMQVSARPTRFLNARGKIVTAALNVGIIEEPVTLWVEKSRVMRVEGGGEVGAYLDRTLKELDAVDFQVHGGPGVRWLEEITFTTHPKEFGVWKPGTAFSALFNNWKGAHYRSGVIHISVGARAPELPADVDRLYRFVFELYFPTLEINGTRVVDRGRLRALDDPEIRAVAARFGNPDELLSEAWIPAIPGVNVPAKASR